MSPCLVTSLTHIIYDIVTKLQLQFSSSGHKPPMRGHHCRHWTIRGQKTQVAAASESQALVTGIGCEQKNNNNVLFWRINHSSVHSFQNFFGFLFLCHILKQLGINLAWQQTHTLTWHLTSTDTDTSVVMPWGWSVVTVSVLMSLIRQT